LVEGVEVVRGGFNPTVVDEVAEHILKQHPAGGHMVARELLAGDNNVGCI